MRHLYAEHNMSMNKLSRGEATNCMTYENALQQPCGDSAVTTESQNKSTKPARHKTNKGVANFTETVIRDVLSSKQ